MDHQKKELYTAKRESGASIDDETLRAYKDLREGSTNNWLLSIYNNNSGQIHSSGIELQNLIDSLVDEDVYFGVVKVLVNTQVKYFHLFFMGANVGGMKRGKASLHKSGILQKLEGCHGEIYFEGKDSITVAKITEQIAKISNINAASVTEYKSNN